MNVLKHTVIIDLSITGEEQISDYWCKYYLAVNGWNHKGSSHCGPSGAKDSVGSGWGGRSQSHYRSDNPSSLVRHLDFGGVPQSFGENKWIFGYVFLDKRWFIFFIT